MELIVRRPGQDVRLSVEQGEVGYQVRLGDRTLTVERTETGNGLRSLLVDGRQHEVSVLALGQGRYRVGSAHGDVEVEVLDPLSELAGRRPGNVGSPGPRRVSAYMPGRVVAVLVVEGQRVESGQGLVVLEAMKMQNEIVAESAGVVRAVHVSAGQAVEGGDPLFEIA